MVVVNLDDSGHVVAGMVPAAAALAEEQTAGDHREKNAGNTDEESPVEHHLVLVKANVMLLVHESTIDTDSNTDTDG